MQLRHPFPSVRIVFFSGYTTGSATADYREVATGISITVHAFVLGGAGVLFETIQQDLDLILHTPRPCWIAIQGDN